METKEWYLKHGYTEEEIEDIEQFLTQRNKRSEIRRTISDVCTKIGGLLFLRYDGSINTNSIEKINAAMSELRGKNIEPVRVSVSIYGTHQYSAFYNF